MNKTFENKVTTKAAGKLKLESGELELPVIVGTENEHAIDISKLRAKTGYITWDEAYVNTGATTSAITFLDGEAGILRYRGYPVEQLAANCHFIEVSYLLLFGELPTKAQLEDFHDKLRLFPLSIRFDARLAHAVEWRTIVEMGVAHRDTSSADAWKRRNTAEKVESQ